MILAHELYYETFIDSTIICRVRLTIPFDTGDPLPQVINFEIPRACLRKLANDILIDLAGLDEGIPE